MVKTGTSKNSWPSVLLSCIVHTNRQAGFAKVVNICHFDAHTFSSYGRDLRHEKSKDFKAL